MSVDLLIAIVAALLSLLASYVPGFAAWYAAKDENYKKLLMLAALVAVTVLAYVAACLELAAQLGLSITCDSAGALALIKTLILAITVNQSVYKISPTTEKVKEIRDRILRKQLR